MDISDLKIIGESSNSIIYMLPRQHSAQSRYVLKLIPHPKNQCTPQCHQLHTEFSISQQFSHKNILRHEEFYPQNEENTIEIDLKNEELYQKYQITGVCGCAILMQYAEGVDLIDMVNKNPQLFYNLNVIKSLFKQAAYGLQEMHSEGFAHNDVKLDNLFAFKTLNNKINIKLADFGFSDNNNKQSRMNQKQKFYRRQREIMSPELLNLVSDYDNNYNFLMVDEKKCDVYSLGIAMIEAFTKVVPYADCEQPRDEDPVYQCLINRQFKQFWRFFPKHLVMLQNCMIANSEEQLQEFFELVVQMIEPNPDARLDIDQVLQHEFFN